MLQGVCCLAQRAIVEDNVYSLDLPNIEQKRIVQLLRYNAADSFRATITIRAFQISAAGSDSICLYHLQFADKQFKRGAHTLILPLQKSSRQHTLDPSFVDVLRRFGHLPPGAYITYLSIEPSPAKSGSAAGPHPPRRFEQKVLWSVDSTLPLQSPLRQQANSAFAAGKRAPAPSPAPAGLRSAAAAVVDAPRAVAKLAKKFGRTRGVSVQPFTLGGKSYAALYYKDWFIGRYELADGATIRDRAAAEATTLQSGASSLVTNNLEDFQSVSSQMRDLFGKGQEGGALEGTLDLSTYGSTGQESGSEQDLNYAELLGAVSTEVFDMPVGIEGYYTTQDRGRQAKASYIRLRYDVEKAKSELANLISAYRSKYDETQAKGKGLAQVYGSYLSNLQSQKDGLTGSLGREYGLDAAALSRYGGDVDKMLSEAPGAGLDTAAILGEASAAAQAAVTGDSAVAARASAAKARYDAAKEKVLRNKEEIQKRYAQLLELEQKAEKYATLLSQYRDGVYLDSAINGTKLQTLAQTKDASYKDMAKAASGLLPEGKAKTFVSGLTHLEAGILNRYESSYTWAGQQATGGSLGYDLGFAQVSATAGRTEYVSRTGQVDRYTAYSGRADFEPLKDQKLSVIYYGYSPSRAMITDPRFSARGVDLALPTFTSPVHILSVVAGGTAAGSLVYSIEAAASHRKDASGIAEVDGVQQKKPLVSMANSAIKSSVEWAVPKTPVSLAGEWEHLGRDFQNSSLPYTRAGTDRYTIGGEAELFKSFLSVGVQYNALRQESFSSTGYSNKWGFEIKTRSRRYPSLALSYKPFATFRTYDDTLSIAQRPMVGAVWTGRGSYQVKRAGGVVHRFTALLNSNSTSAGDSTDYRSTTAQGGYIYSASANTVTVTGGWMALPLRSAGGTGAGSGGGGGSSSEGRALQTTSTYFLSGGWNRSLGKQINANAGADAALAPFGLQRLAFTLGGSYAFARWPLSMRLQGRWAQLRADALYGTQTILSGAAGLAWTFRTKPLLGKKG